VLGSLESANDWHWAAWGKHPVAKDYFTLGLSAPLLKAFSEWVEKGYQMLGSRERASSKLYSWRFWARGPKSKIVVCGVARDSSDSLGRPYPLLIMGTGALEGWEDQWDLLPFVCEETWRQIEYMSTKRFIDFGQFEDEVRLIKPPYPRWSEFVSQREHFQGGSSWNPADMERKALGPPDKPEIFVPIDVRHPNDPFAVAGLWHAFLKSRIGGVPNAVFLGGAPDETHLAVFRRALVPADFVRLWSELDIT
jgi:type VI secretion system protein VasJ